MQTNSGTRWQAHSVQAMDPAVRQQAWLLAAALSTLNGKPETAAAQGAQGKTRSPQRSPADRDAAARALLKRVVSAAP